VPFLPQSAQKWFDSETSRSCRYACRVTGTLPEFSLVFGLRADSCRDACDAQAERMEEVVNCLNVSTVQGFGR
jgi:hypothetical protein